MKMAAVETFKTVILKIRDILRGPGSAITGPDSMQHICVYLMARYLTREKCATMGIPADHAWEAILDTARHVAGGKQFALDIFAHPAMQGTLISYLDTHFGSQRFPFTLQNVAKHYEILELLDMIDLTSVDKVLDTFGWVYEQHARTGSKGKGSRDLGQYFTDRAICNFMVDLCAPGVKSTGVPESVCDPTMGTGGFLYAYIHYLTHNASAIDWSIHASEIHGCDVDQIVATIARMSMFITLGGNKAANLLTQDSLYHDLPRAGYDVILANMPFGVRGIRHAECCEKVKSMGIRGTKSEPLFLQLMMASLNEGGRCAVVLPDSVLIDRGTLQIGTRKYLLENFEVRKVIKTRGQFFMNTSIQPSIIYFVNSGYSTDEIEFSEITKNADGSVSEKHIITVAIDDLDQHASLNPAKYIPAAPKPILHLEQYPTVTISNLYECPGNVKKFNSGDKTDTGTVPFFNGKWNCPDGCHSDTSFESKDDYFIVVCNGNGRHTSTKVGLGSFFSCRGKCAITSCNTILTQKNPNAIQHKFIAHWMNLARPKVRDYAHHSVTGIQHISITDILAFEINLPPPEIQAQIVVTLDHLRDKYPQAFANIIKVGADSMYLMLMDPSGDSFERVLRTMNLKYMSDQYVEKMQEQMKMFIGAAEQNQPRGRLADVAEFTWGAQIDPKTFVPRAPETLAVLKHKNVVDGVARICDAQDWVANGPTIQRLRANDIVVSTAYDCGRIGWIPDDTWALSCDTGVIRPRDAQFSAKYLYWCLRLGDFGDKMREAQTGITVKHVRHDDIMNASIALPPRAIQDEAVRMIEEIQHAIDEVARTRTTTRERARFVYEGLMRTIGRQPSEQQGDPSASDDEDYEHESVESNPDEASTSGTQADDDADATHTH